MNNKPNNFKTAVNELLGAKEEQKAEPLSEAYEPIARQAMPTFNAGQSAATIISKDTVIQGSVFSTSDLQIFGRVKGDVKSEGNITTSGIIEGNVESANLVIQQSSIRGNVTAKGMLSLQDQSTVIGDVYASDADIDGHIKGNLRIMGLANIKDKAVILGNIGAKSVSLQSGAQVSGNLELFERAITDDMFDLAAFGDIKAPIKHPAQEQE